jgi:hypothetical protein
VTIDHKENPTVTIIDKFLAAGGYESLDAWMLDSGYEKRDGEWYYGPNDPNNGDHPHPLDPEGVILGAIEASGFGQNPTITVGELRTLLTQQPADRPIIVGSDQRYLNVTGLTLDDEQLAIVIETRDDFDTHQW